MNIRFGSYFSAFLLSISPFVTNATETPTSESAFALDISIELSKEQVDNTGGYVSASIGMENVGEIDANIKYWVSVTGPQGLSFPAKSVVSANSSEFQVDDVEEGTRLNFKRGIWVRDYMSDGIYEVSVEGVNIDTGAPFKQSVQFTKGVDTDGGKRISGLTIQSKLLSADNFGSEGGYALISMDIQNTSSQPIEVEFWVNAVAANAFDIPVHARVTRIIAPNSTEQIVRGFWLDATYPDGEYVVTPQFFETVSGERVDFQLKLFKGAL
ncbi:MULTISPECIES: RbmA family biofilm matrix protein [Vibrio]|uniref:RbmA family biofilm matrix protein n=1 Tax=Vibrio TaxID=662 RepID=UPI000BFF9561|nr:RbmA protein [Vibrio sp. PID17_43]